MRRTTLPIVLVASALCWGEEPMPVPVEQLGGRFQLVGRLHEPLGACITVQGVVVEGPFKGYEGGPNLHVQRIQGRATQEDIQICIRPYFNDWGKKPNTGLALPKLEMGKTYEMEGYSTGGYVGVPGEAFEKAGAAIQITGHYFREQFVVYRAKQIEPIRFGPQDFRGKKALLEGTAKSVGGKAVIGGEGWTVIVDAKKGWGKDIEGKLVESYGLYNPTEDAKSFTLVDGVWRLVRLEDQVGRQVELRGRARSLNGVWWFHYRGVDLYVEDMEKLPGWSEKCHWQAMVIRGTLERAKLPRLDQITEKPDRDLDEYFIVRKASWEPVERLLGVERGVGGGRGE